VVLDETTRERAIALAESIKNLNEYREFLKMEKLLREDGIAQKMIFELQKKQEDFVSMQLSGEFDQNLLNELKNLQSELNKRESVVNFIESYNKLSSILEEIIDVISKEIEFDIGEIYRR